MAGASFGIGTEPTTDPAPIVGAKPLQLTGIGSGSHLFVRHVDFGDSPGAAVVHLRVATPLRGVMVAISANLAVGTSAPAPVVIAECQIPVTGSWDTWTTLRCPVMAARAVGIASTVRFEFGVAGPFGQELNQPELIKFRSWQFYGGSTSDKTPPAVTVPVIICARGAGGRYLVVRAHGGAVTATEESANTEGTKFTLVDNEDGSWGVLAVEAGLLLCVEAGRAHVAASEPTGSPAQCARFRFQPTVDGSWAVQSYLNWHWLAPIGPEARIVAAALDPRGLGSDAGRFEIKETLP